MCSIGTRTANVAVSKLIFVIGKLFVTPMPAEARTALAAFADNPTDAGLRELEAALIDHALLPMAATVVADITHLGGLDLVLQTADWEHRDNFHRSMSAIQGG